MQCWRSPCRHLCNQKLWNMQRQKLRPAWIFLSSDARQILQKLMTQKQKRLPRSSDFKVRAILNRGLWFGTRLEKCVNCWGCHMKADTSFMLPLMFRRSYRKTPYVWDAFSHLSQIFKRCQKLVCNNVHLTRNCWKQRRFICSVAWLLSVSFYHTSLPGSIALSLTKVEHAGVETTWKRF